MSININTLWIAKDWRLLQQASNDLLRRYGWIHVGRIGGDFRKLQMPEISQNIGSNEVAFTTIRTLYNLIRNCNFYCIPSLLVWDELHWSQNSTMGRYILRFCKDNNIRVLGLTATPRQDDTFFVAFEYAFSDMVRDGWLASPVIENAVPTGIEWSPELNDVGDFNKSSLIELATNMRRNRLIAEHYNTNAKKFGQTLVFACNIEHANLLVNSFMELGITVAAIHSAVHEKKRNMFINNFQTKAIRVLINVEMLTTGVDLPSVKTIFLCRPTTSDILLQQMIGRGARKHEGKSDFYIVEFTDNIKTYGDLLITPKIFFNGAGSSNPNIDRRAQRSDCVKHHEFNPFGLPMWITDDPALAPSIRGLWLRRDQTFGIEFELTYPDMPDIKPSDPRWSLIATKLLMAIRSATEYAADEPIHDYAGSGRKNCFLWNVEYDASVGFEVTSRILYDQEGYEEVARVCAALNEVSELLGLTVNHTTGTHIHLGWESNSLDELRRLVRLVRLAEPALGTLVAPSRLVAFNGCTYNLDRPNVYCEPLSTSLTELDIDSWSNSKDAEEMFWGCRNVTLNLNSLFIQDTVEVRFHSGTIDPGKILLWLSLWQQILWAASVDRSIPITEDCEVITPDGDIVAFARKWLPNANEPSQVAFLRRLDARRRDILAIWRLHPKIRSWVKFSRTWQNAD